MLIRKSIGYFVGITKGFSIGLGGSKRLGEAFLKDDIGVAEWGTAQ